MNKCGHIYQNPDGNKKKINSLVRYLKKKQYFPFFQTNKKDETFVNIF